MPDAVAGNGNGNATLAAARRGCRVTSTDDVSTLLDRARSAPPPNGST